MCLSRMESYNDRERAKHIVQLVRWLQGLKNGDAYYEGGGGVGEGACLEVGELDYLGLGEGLSVESVVVEL